MALGTPLLPFESTIGQFQKLIIAYKRKTTYTKGAFHYLLRKHACLLLVV